MYKDPERQEAYLELRKLRGQKVYKSKFSPSHPKVTLTLSQEFRDFKDQAIDNIESDTELAVIDTLLRNPRGLRRWRLDRYLRDLGFEIYPDIDKAVESLVHKGLVEYHRAPTS